jgi:hypothetical protein
MPAQQPTQITPKPEKARQNIQREQAAQQGADAAKAAQRALGSASSIRDIRPKR